MIEHLPGPSGHTRDGKGKYSDKLTWDLMPFCGTVATAPEREVVTSLLGQGPFGGNIDCRELRAGHTIYLNSYHKGRAPLHRRRARRAGRHGVHRHRRRDALHGATELFGGEEQAHPLRAGRKTDSIVAIGINLPMEHAVYDACWNMMEWLRDDYGIALKDIVHPHVLRPAFRIRTYQMVRAVTLQHVVGAE